MRRSVVKADDDVDENQLVDEIEDDNDSDRPNEVGFVSENLRLPLDFTAPKHGRSNSIKFKKVYHGEKPETQAVPEISAFANLNRR